MWTFYTRLQTFWYRILIYHITDTRKHGPCNMYTADITSTTAVTCGPKQHESHQNVQNIVNNEILPDSLT